jgi:phage shock protein C
MTMNEPSGSRRMHRSRDERLLFGVCGGLAEYFGVDPTIVRIGFVLAGLFPPTSGISVIGYILLAVILPQEGTEDLAARDRVGRNVDELRTEISSFADKVRARVTGETPMERSMTESASDMTSRDGGMRASSTTVDPIDAAAGGQRATPTTEESTQSTGATRY